MKLCNGSWILGAALLLSACGGGGGSAGTPVLGSGGAAASSPTTTVTVATVELIASSVQVPSGGDQVTVTATVKGTGNVSLPSTAIVFSADSGTLTSAQSTTDATGAATVILSAGSDRSNRNIVVTAVSGTASGKITLPVVGTTLSYSGVTTVPLSGSVQGTVTAKDSKGTPISGLPVTISSSLGNTLAAASVTTDLRGVSAVGYTATKAGVDTLSFAAGGVTVTTPITVSAENFTFVSPAANTTIPVGVPQMLTVQYLSNGVAQSGKQIAFAATAGALTVANPSSPSPCSSAVTTATATTDTSGKAMVCVRSATASPATAQATLIGSSVSAQATLPIAFVAVTPAKLVLQATPTALSPNGFGSTAQAATVQATVFDVNGNPVSGVTVNFNRCSDPSGGNLSQASAVTNSGGQATVQYIAGTTSTASNGVLLQATVQGSPAIDVAACVAGSTNASKTNNTASLTVSQSALFISLGTGNTIIEIDKQTYQQDWVVYVTDSNGVAVSNVGVTIKILPAQYLKGQLVLGDKGWSYDLPSISVCSNEDANYNGVLDVNEDFNGDGMLEPGNVISATTSSTSGASSGTVTTGPNGRATISVVYAKSYANWLEVKLVASAIVSGTESSNEQMFVPAGLVADYEGPGSPPGQFSPFGTNTCGIPK